MREPGIVSHRKHPSETPRYGAPAPPTNHWQPLISAPTTPGSGSACWAPAPGTAPGQCPPASAACDTLLAFQVGQRRKALTQMSCQNAPDTAATVERAVPYERPEERLSPKAPHPPSGQQHQSPLRLATKGGIARCLPVEEPTRKSPNTRGAYRVRSIEKQARQCDAVPAVSNHDGRSGEHRAHCR